MWLLICLRQQKLLLDKPWSKVQHNGFITIDWKKTSAYVKDEKSNPNVITIALKYVMRSCKLLGLDESF
jgi:hypothetical protein